MKDVIVQLRIFRGKPTYDENGKITSNHSLVKLAHGRLEWTNFKKSIFSLGITKIDIVKCLDPTKDYKECDAPEGLEAEVKEMITPTNRTPMTKEQQEIAELKADLVELKAAKSGKKEKPDKGVDVSVNVDAKNASDKDELKSARDQYFNLFGKKPSHLMKLPKLNEKIAEKLAESEEE